MYHIISKAKRKNAKRHIIEKVENYNDLIQRLNHWCELNNNYIYEAYNGKWELIFSMVHQKG